MSVADVASVIAAVASGGALVTSIYVARVQGKSAQRLERARWLRGELQDSVTSVFRNLGVIEQSFTLFRLSTPPELVPLRPHELDDIRKAVKESREKIKFIERLSPEPLRRSCGELHDALVFLGVSVLGPSAPGNTLRCLNDFDKAVKVFDRAARKTLGID